MDLQNIVNTLPDIVNTLPAPQCPEDLGTQCPGPFQPIDPVTGKPIGGLVEPCERVVSESRPGEIDVDVRCKSCQAREHYTIDAATGQIIEPAGLFARRSRDAAPSASSAPAAAPSDKGTRGQADKGRGNGMGSGISDSLYGGAGSDTLSGGGGSSVTLAGGGCNDSLPPTSGGSGPSITLQTTGGNDTLSGH